MKIIQPVLNENEVKALNRILEYLGGEEADYAELFADERPPHIFHSVLALRASGLAGPALFETGQLRITPGAATAISRANQEAWNFLCRHTARNWGDLCAVQWHKNNRRLEIDERLFSSYRTAAGETLLVITEAERSFTTIRLTEES